MSLDDLAAQLIASKGENLAEWEQAMRDMLRDEYRIALELVKGGPQNITQSDWGYMGSMLKEQYAYLSEFAFDIAIHPDQWLNGRLMSRMNLYKQSAYGALEQFQRRAAEQAGFTEERRRLGVPMTEHCHPHKGRPGCEELAAREWQSIGTLPKIGEAACYTNCLCTFDYRKPDGAGGWVVEGG